MKTTTIECEVLKNGDILLGSNSDLIYYVKVNMTKSSFLMKLTKNEMKEVYGYEKEPAPIKMIKSKKELSIALSDKKSININQVNINLHNVLLCWIYTKEIIINGEIITGNF